MKCIIIIGSQAVRLHRHPLCLHLFLPLCLPVPFFRFSLWFSSSLPAVCILLSAPIAVETLNKPASTYSSVRMLLFIYYFTSPRIHGPSESSPACLSTSPSPERSDEAAVFKAVLGPIKGKPSSNWIRFRSVTDRFDACLSLNHVLQHTHTQTYTHTHTHIHNKSYICNLRNNTNSQQ